MAEKIQGSSLNGLHTDVDRFLPGYFLRRDQGERKNNPPVSPVLLLSCILLFFWCGLGLWSAGHPEKGSKSKESGVEHYLRDTAMADDFVPMRSGRDQIPAKKEFFQTGNYNLRRNNQ